MMKYRGPEIYDHDITPPGGGNHDVETVSSLMSFLSKYPSKSDRNGNMTIFLGKDALYRHFEYTGARVRLLEAKSEAPLK